MRFFWRSSHDTFQYLASHVLGDCHRADGTAWPALVCCACAIIKCGLLRGFRPKLVIALYGHLWFCGVDMSGEDAPRPCLETLIVLETKTNKQIC